MGCWWPLGTQDREDLERGQKPGRRRRQACLQAPPPRAQLPAKPPPGSLSLTTAQPWEAGPTGRFSKTAGLTNELPDEP